MTGGAGAAAAVLPPLVALCLTAGIGRPRGSRAARSRAAGLCGAPRPAGRRFAPTFPQPGRWFGGWPGRRPPEADGRLPLATELLAACLAAGAAPREAADAVGSALGGPVGDGLRRAAAELRLGGDPATVWQGFGQLPGAAALARRLELAHTGGAPVAELVAAEAVAVRARRLRSAQARARRAAVYVTGPLGLCFLPSFLLLGVAPVVLGLARELL
ncbi:type II secretion system F family protein [Streptomyces sp. 4N509B]|uniref:type II secretion system F family protein n=1 Tax=Streptomyces sp. 4N509B TaxID=3457413 RepID=UPI003FCF1F11